jgi:hypothetical protein
MSSVHVIVLPGGGYQVHAPHGAEAVAAWLESRVAEVGDYLQFAAEGARRVA